MNDPSSRTPEGVPHRCKVCGTEFSLNRSISGDACCPNCNSLAWPIGDDRLGSQPPSNKTTTLRTKEVRIRPGTDDTDIGNQTRRVISLLQKRYDVTRERRAPCDVAARWRRRRRLRRRRRTRRRRGGATRTRRARDSSRIALATPASDAGRDDERSRGDDRCRGRQR